MSPEQASFESAGAAETQQKWWNRPFLRLVLEAALPLLICRSRGSVNVCGPPLNKKVFDMCCYVWPACGG